MIIYHSKLLFHSRPINKGASLLVTVLIGLIAASIAISIIRTSLDNSRETLSKRAEDVAYSKAVKNIILYKSKLRIEPLLFLEKVDILELPRVCANQDGEGNNVTIQPGELWPAECGTSWSYEDVDSNDYITIIPPDNNGYYLKLISYVKTGGVKIGYEELLSIAGIDFSLVSEGDLPNFKKGTGYLSLENNVYINGEASLSGNIYPNGKRIIVNSSINSDEFASNLIDKNNDLYKTVSDNLISRGDLRVNYNKLLKIACSKDDRMKNIITNSNQLCIKKGKILRDFDNNSITVPEYIDKILILPEKVSSDRVEVYYANNNVSAKYKCDVEGCSLRSESYSDTSHVGRITSWNFLGSFYIPFSGIIYSDLDLYLGICGESAYTNLGNCDTLDDVAQAGLEPDHNYLFLAGSINKPKDIYFSGPINEGLGSFSAFSTGSIFIPFFASASNNLLKIYSDLLILGYNENLLSSLPDSNLVNLDNKINNIEIKGEIIVGEGVNNLSNFSNLTTIAKNSKNSYIGNNFFWKSTEKKRIVN